MNPIRQQHIDMVRKLRKDPTTIELGWQQRDMLHALMGVMSEYCEIVEAFDVGPDNMREELGDVEFYLTQLCIACGIDVGIMEREEKSAFISISMALANYARLTSEICDLVKKHTIYEQPLDRDKLIELIEGLFTDSLEIIYDEYDFFHTEVLEANMRKLAKRYPDYKYTNERAHERADKTETN